MPTRLCGCTTPSRHRASKTLHNSVKHDKGRGRRGDGGNIQVARTTPATSWRFPAMRRPGRWPELGRARDRPRRPRRHGPMSINTGESRSTSSRGLRRIELIFQLLITAHRRQDSRYDLDHCSLHLPGANATGDKHAGARPWCCCSLAYERGGQLHHGASRQQIMGHLCLRGVYLCPMAAASLDAKPSTLLGPSRGSLGRRDKDDGRDHDDDEEFSTPPPSCRGCPSRVDITTDQASAKRLDLMKRSFAPFVSSIRHGTRKPDVVL